MLRVVVGTKGQLIKMAPILLELDRRKINYEFIHAGQHTSILNHLLQQFNLEPPDFYFSDLGEDVKNEKQFLIWITKNFIKYGLSNKYFRKKESNDILLNHGDAPPALLGLLIAKIKRMKTAHIEAGERTYKLFKPFPEEIIRQLLDRYSNYLFASSFDSHRNLNSEKRKGEIYNVNENTLIDSVRIAISSDAKLLSKEKFVLSSIHRYETIISKKNLSFLIDKIDMISRNHHVVFPIHPSTLDKIKKFGLYDKINNNSNIFIHGLLDYFHFIKHIKESEFIYTDGGGPQQESFYLGTPCLLMRETSERLVFPNVVLSRLKTAIVEEFIENYEVYRQESVINQPIYPSKNIVDILIEKEEL